VVSRDLEGRGKLTGKAEEFESRKEAESTEDTEKSKSRSEKHSQRIKGFNGLCVPTREHGNEGKDHQNRRSVGRLTGNNILKTRSQTRVSDTTSTVKYQGWIFGYY